MKNAVHSQPEGRIVGLDGLRGISILLVLAGHGWSTLPSTWGFAVLAPYLANAKLGVQTFFVISGFLITYLLRREREKTGTISLKAFYVRRVLRIFPALYVFLLVLTLIRKLGWISTTYADIVISGTFLTNYKHFLPFSSNEDYWFVGQFWTLSLEEQYYLLWPATILIFGMLRAEKLALLIVLTAPFARIATYFAFPGSRGQLGMMLHTGADPIMVGCLAALWQGRPLFEKMLNRLSSWYWPSSTLLFLFVVSPWLNDRFRGMYSVTVGISFNSIAVAFLMLWVIRHPRSFPVRLLSTPLARHVGVLSYSLYLWNPLFLTPNKNQSWTGAFPTNFFICFVIAELSYWVVERPFLRLRDYYRSNQTSPLSSTTDAGLKAKEAVLL